eukprot:TRINITY_DN16480_c0_g1_i1.p4 TRINITY_DN16480_c0_g1~~TRINITY_DN16480_c0_g1_i1.p4  ORF type:complete len:55 (-),score=9.92 TRINITY_DN16480_c0_g1_i1:698-862(-)
MMNESCFSDMTFVVGDPSKPKGCQRFQVMRAFFGGEEQGFQGDVVRSHGGIERA